MMTTNHLNSRANCLEGKSKKSQLRIVKARSREQKLHQKSLIDHDGFRPKKKRRRTNDDWFLLSCVLTIEKRKKWTLAIYGKSIHWAWVYFYFLFQPQMKLKQARFKILPKEVTGLATKKCALFHLILLQSRVVVVIYYCCS